MSFMHPKTLEINGQEWTRTEPQTCSNCGLVVQVMPWGASYQGPEGEVLCHHPEVPGGGCLMNRQRK